MASRSFLVKLMVVTLVLTGASIWICFGLDPVALVLQVLEHLRSTGPALFFLAMALLPSIGAPLSLFSLTAGSVFGPQFGMPVVMLLSLAAIATNIALSYLLASRALRPPLKSLLVRLGYPLPRVPSGDVTDLIVLLRVTPGLPFPVQNYLLGLAEVPFIRYFVVSCLITLPLNAAIIFFGEALLQGQGRMALVGLLLVVAAIAVIHLVRRHYSARKAT